MAEIHGSGRTNGTNDDYHCHTTDQNSGKIAAGSTPIAIIGMSCKFAGGATSPDKLWRLCIEGRSGWSGIPKSRFNAAAFFDADHEKNGSTNACGGYFIEDDISLFDASFFNFSHDVASTMDPQIRLQLESVYEATEDGKLTSRYSSQRHMLISVALAGLPLERLAGSNTSVFAGCFARDYNDSLTRDPDTTPRTMLTGNGAAMLSNRISHFFDLRGPSMTIDTGCSASMTSLHLGCQSLRTGDADVSIVTAANVMLNPDFFNILSNLGVLSDDGRCYAWDDRACGYGRGEGLATLLLKPLEQAIEDGDNVRAVIRGTSVNQDGKTPTITSPSVDAQKANIRDCYRRAGLDPSQTPYVEAHMTGTITGDPIEANAISDVFGLGRAENDPVIVGSIKTNLGHLEAASGLAGVVKTVLALEKGLIPANLNYERPNPAIDMRRWNITVPTAPTTWPEHLPRRASVNNFAYGGTNAHAIFEAFPQCSSASDMRADKHVENGDANSQSASSDTFSNENRLRARSRAQKIFVLSSKDASVTSRMMTNLADLACQYGDESTPIDLASLAHTLAERRSRFPWRAAVTANSLEGLTSALQDPKNKPALGRTAPRIGFVFNGQGAQWATMGKELFTYPVYASAMHEADEILRSYGASWSLIDEILKEGPMSRVHEQMFTPLSVALQICLVRLLASWGVSPCAVASHSSGEVSAAFAAGGLTFAEALGVVYFRGSLAEKYQSTSVSRGAMLAAGLSAQEAAIYTQRLTRGSVVVGCVNSPNSITLSGDSDAVVELEGLLRIDGIFARKLRVNAAYHSHHMLPMAEEYRQCLEHLITPKKDWTGIAYGSPVTGQLVRQVGTLDADHWVRNLTQPVLFAPALESICASTCPDSKLDVILELGPHGVLAGPIRQILSGTSLKTRSISYYSCLTRNEDSIQTIQSMVCSLFCKGSPIDLKAVNMDAAETKLIALSDLPSYPWNHTTKYWKESRINQALRNRTHACDELLGRFILGTNPQRPCWRHFLKASELPWLRDHCVQSDTVFPAAGMLSMAIQAMQQLAEPSDSDISGYKIRNVEIMNALVVPDTVEGVEVQLSFSPCSKLQLDDKGWWEFHLYSISQLDSSWVEHCTGFISVVPNKSSNGFWQRSTNTISANQLGRSSFLRREKTRTVDPAKLFADLRSRGINHGPAFQNLVDIHTDVNHSISTFRISDCTNSKYVIHPTTLDSIFQAAYASLGHDAYRGSMVLPHSVGEMFVSQSIAHQRDHVFRAQTLIECRDKRGFRSSLSVMDADCSYSTPQVELRNFFCQAVAAALPSGELDGVSKTCFKTTWDVDWTLMPAADLKKSLSFPTDPQEVVIGKNLIRATFHLIHDTLAHLSEADIEQLDWHQKLFLRWMQTQDHLGTTGQLAHDSASWTHSSADKKQLLFDEVSAASVNGRLLCRVGSNLLDILRHKSAPLELMMNDRLLFDFYETAIRCHRSYAQVKKLVTYFAHKMPRGKILEIGGGTGGCTTSVLEALSGNVATDDCHFSRYDFTDISSGFFDQAATKFSTWSHLMNFKKLDIERQPSAQGFEPGSYDLIVACQVLHATKRMEVTMSNVRQLLKPGGKLIMVETTKDTADMQLIFGTLPGWWLGERRTESPNMSVQSWQDILTTTGFTGLDVEVGDCEDPDHYSFSTMLTTASPPVPTYPEELSIISPLCVPRTWLDDLKASITRATGIPTVEAELTTNGSHGKYYLYLLEMLEPLLPHLDADTFMSLREMLATSKGGLWVTSGGLLDGGAPDFALHTGLLRTLRIENTTKKLISCDLPQRDNPWTAGSCRVLTELIRATFNLDPIADGIDCEYAVRDSDIHVARIYEDHDANDAATALSNTSQTELNEFIGSPMPLRIDVGTTGLLDSIRFIENKEMYEPLNNEYIEIEPRAFGLNFRDVLVALGHIDGTTLGFECSGIVTRVGANAEQSGLKVGDRVCAIMQGHFGTPVRLHWTWAGRISNETSFEEAASIPMAFITAYQSLYESARLEEGESVLIHAAAGAVGQAAIMLAQHRKAEIFVTVGTKTKRDFIMETYGIPMDHISSSRDESFATDIMAHTQGKGVAVVLNSLSGNLLKASWDCIASFGRFIEIGKRDIEQNKSLNMAPLRRAASFAAIDLDHMTRLRGDVVAKALREILRLWDHRHIKAVTPVRCFPVSDVTGAFRFMQSGKHLGKIVITPMPGDLVQVLPAVKHVKFVDDASYLLAGGVGGIGRRLACYMAGLGCKNLIMVSRSAEQHVAVPELIRELADAGCRALVLNCDVADPPCLATFLKVCTGKGMPPIRGVIQAAMALHDSSFERMTFDQWQAALRPKHAATWNLHNQLPGLDFLVMLSSLTGVVGSISQANYSAGSTFQDAFARYRTTQGLPAVSVDLGSIKGVGYVAEHGSIVERLTKVGFEPIEELETMRIIESAMQNPYRPLELSQIITGICKWDETMNVAWKRDRRFWSLQTNTAMEASKSGNSIRSVPVASLRDNIARATTWEQAVQHCVDALIHKVSDMFALPVTEVDPTLELASYGVDSLVAVEVRNWLAVTAGTDISIFDIMQSSSVSSLAMKVAQKSRYIAAANLAPG